MNVTATGTLQIHLLGEFYLQIDGEAVTSVVAERPQTLLAYLLLHRRAPQSRQHLAFLLWPDSSESQARTNLRNLIHTLRQILPNSERYLAVEPLTIQWRPDVPFSLDVAQFEQAVEAANQAEDISQMRYCLETAVSLYRGELLPGNYDDWLMTEREGLRQAFLDALEKLIKVLEQSGDYRDAIHYGQRLLQQDPLNEMTYVQLMRLHALSGDRAGLQRIYQTCTAMLERELAVEPSSNTRSAYEQLLRMDVMATSEAMVVPSPTLSVPTWQPRSLPIPPTPFIGRESELAEIAQLLCNLDCRLLTITGLGGIGKTRLALQTAIGHQPVYPNGVAFVALAPLQTPDLLATVIGEALQINFLAATEARRQLFDFLSQKEMLIVLDNFEHLIEGAEMVAALLSAAPGVKLLVTSRQRLDLQGEWTYEIGGLPLPEAYDKALAENSAFALFEQSARRADSRFTVTEEEACHISRICHLVGGVPLAIELAASWVRLLSCAEIAGEIERGLDFLAVSLRNIPERHRSIQAVFNYSWSLLIPSEQEALAQLSVFRGGFTREAAERVAKATLPMLAALVDKSLVRRHKSGQYDLHELIRQYAHEQLVQSEGFDNTYERHFEFFLELAEKSKCMLRGSEQIVWLKRLEQDYDNLRAALGWSLRESTTESEPYPAQKALRLTAALYPYWKLHASWGNGRRWLQRALARAPQSPPAIERAEVIHAAALLAVEQADTQAAQQLAKEGLALARVLEDSHSIAQAFYALALVLWKQKKYGAAREYGKQALARFRELGKKIHVADSLKVLGRIATNEGDLASAHYYFQECLTFYEALEDRLEYNWVLSDLGLLAYLGYDFATARLYHEESLRLFREVGSIAGTEMALNRLGDVARCENNFDEAERCYTECLAAYQQTADKDEIPSLLHNLGYVAKHRGEYARAIDLFREGLAMQMETGNQGGIAECLAGIAAVLTIQGDMGGGAHLFGAAEILREKVGAILWPANCLEYESSLAILHEAMDEASLDMAWTAGRTLSIEEVYSLIQSELAYIESETSPG